MSDNGNINERKSYQLTEPETAFLKEIKAQEATLEQQYRELSQARRAALLLLCKQNGLEGNYRLSDDFITLAPVEQAAEPVNVPERG